MVRGLHRHTGAGRGAQLTPGSGLLTDLYELTMAAAYVAEGTAELPATFSLFVRGLPPTRGYLVAAGLEGALSFLDALHFSDEDIAYLSGLGLFSSDALDRLASLRFTGTVRAVPEGTIVFGGEPLLEVTGPVIEAQIVETFLLNQLTVGTVLASKAARYRHAAGGRSIADFAFRRSQGLDGGMTVARVAGLVGVQSTSNVAAGRLYGLPVTGTMAHAFVQSHGDEVEAFRVFGRLFKERAALLVDTYDSRRGIDRAVAVGVDLAAEGVSVGALRLDSGDLDGLARYARAALDKAGLSDVRVLASGGLNEHTIAALVAGGAPIDSFGVGTDLGVSADAPVVDTVYKLVEFNGRPVRKLSLGKETWPGPKQVWRRGDWSGDVLGLADEAGPDGGSALLLPVALSARPTLTEANAHFEDQWAGLPAAVKDLQAPVSYPVEPSEALLKLTEEVDGNIV